MKITQPALTVLAVLAFAIYPMLIIEGCSRDKDNAPRTYVQYKNNPDWRGGERGEIVPAAYFTGMARAAYASAALIPDVLDHMYCYCHCEEDHGHNSLRTCFTDGHGAGCDICIKEAIRARQLHEEGYNIREIRAKIDREFYRPYKR